MEMVPTISLSVSRDVRRMPIIAHGSRKDESAQGMREHVIGQGRFGKRCHFCSFSFGTSDLFELHNLDHDHQNHDPANFVPVCELCHAPFHIDLVARKWPDDKGRIIFLPELTQVELNNLLQATFYAMAVGKIGEENESGSKPIVKPHTIYQKLEMRADLVEKNSVGEVVRKGLSDPFVFGRVLSELDDETYSRRDEIFHGLRYLAPQSHFETQAQSWNANNCAFSKLDMAAWPGIAC